MDSVWSFFSSFWASVVALFGWVFDTIFGLFQSFYYWVAVTSLSIAIDMLEPVIGHIDFSPLRDLWNSAPPVLFEIAARVGVNDALTIVISAVGVRLMMSFVPKFFWS